jgi:protein-tyrosine phosphatase
MSDQQHPVWTLPLPNGALILTPCPGTQQVPLDESLKQLKCAGVTALVTLLSDEELQQCGLANFTDAVKNAGFDWFQMPVPDDDVPGQPFETVWQHSEPRIQRHLASGSSVAVHCKGGSGRTGLIAARLMLAQGVSADEAIARIRELRPKAFSLAAQQDYIAQFAS